MRPVRKGLAPSLGTGCSRVARLFGGRAESASLRQRTTTTAETTTAASTPTAAKMATILSLRPNRCILHLPTHVA